MKSIITLFVALICLSCAHAQEKQFPVIKNYGGIYNIDQATVKADPTLSYKIVIDVYTGSDNPAQINPSLNNVARLINLHAVSGANMANMEVVLAIHGTSAFSIMNNAQYKKKFGIDNPNIGLLEELADAGVLLAVCGQSLIARNIPMSGVHTRVSIATSMLTTVTTYQMKGFAFMKF